MKKSLFIIITFISFCFINCGNDNSPSGLEGVNINMNDDSTTSNVDKLIIGSWDCTELNFNDGTGWQDMSLYGIFEIDFYSDGTAYGIYVYDSFMTTWSSSQNTVTLSIAGIPSTITNITSSTFLLVQVSGTSQIDFRFIKL